jgi:AcrR family transcriptional regulator
MRQVAQDLGVSHQAPYVHFGTKRRFLAAVAGVGLQQAAEEATASVAARAEPVDKLHALADAYLAFVRTRRHVHDLAYGPEVAKRDHPLLQAAAITYWNLLRDTVAGCQPPGTSEQDVLRRSAVAWGTVYGIARLANFQQIPASVPGPEDDLVHAALDWLCHGWDTVSPPSDERASR